jgi:hypothetical protein
VIRIRERNIALELKGHLNPYLWGMRNEFRAGGPQGSEPRSFSGPGVGEEGLRFFRSAGEMAGFIGGVVKALPRWIF